MKQELKELPLNQIHSRSNYRKTFRDDSLKELASSIKQNGVLEPIIVRPNNKGFEIVAGERRFRASEIAKKVTIPAVIRAVDDKDVLAIQIIENVQREGVPYMEEAYALAELRKNNDYDTAEISKLIGKSESYVYYMLRLTEMAPDAQTIAGKGWISKAVAFHISKLKTEDDQTRAANDLARTQRGKMVTENGAKSYIRDNFQNDSGPKLRKTRVAAIGGSDYVANWKRYLVGLSCEQFERFKKIVRGRTETEVLAEAVDLVMRREVEG